jgi:hypothetical protein
MFNQIQRLKARQPGLSLVKSMTPRTVTVFLLTLAMLAVLSFKVSAANIPLQACDVVDFCAAISNTQPNSFVPQVVIADTTLVRTGPGTNYYSYDDLPAGTISPVKGISQDGKWWAIPLPISFAQDGTGWVPAAAASVKNVETMPDWLQHCDRMNYCGYILAHSPQYVQVMKPSATAPRFGITRP